MSPVQGYIGRKVASALEDKFGTEVSIGRVDLGFINRLIIDDFAMKDQKGNPLLSSTRLSVKIDLIPLSKGKISISSVQLFGIKANLYRETAKSQSNFQFFIDSLASKDNSTHTPIDLHIGSLIIRHGSLNYNQLDAPKKDLLKHLALNDISTHIILNKLTDDEGDLTIKKLSFKEYSGLEVDDLHFQIEIDDKEAILSNFELDLPHSNLTLGDIHASYELNHPKDKNHMSLGDINPRTLKYTGEIKPSKITPKDLSFLISALSNFSSKVNFSTTFTGTYNSLNINDLIISSSNNYINLAAKGSISNFDTNPKWHGEIRKLNMRDEGIKWMARNFGTRLQLPKEITRLGSMNFKGTINGQGNQLDTKGIFTCDAGKIDINASKNENHVKGHIITNGVDLQRILANKDFGTVATNIELNGYLPTHGQKLPSQFMAKGIIQRFDYQGYSYKNIVVNGLLKNGIIQGLASINDPNIQIKAQGNYNLLNKKYAVKGNIEKYNDIENIAIDANNQGKQSHLNIMSPYANLKLEGQYDYATLPQSFANVIGKRLPTMPGLPKLTKSTGNNFVFTGNLTDAHLLKKYLGLDLDVHQPITIDGRLNDNEHKVELNANLPSFSYSGNSFENGTLHISTPNDTLKANIKLSQVGGAAYSIIANAANNKLASVIGFDNRNKQLHLYGKLDNETQFFKNEEGENALHVNIHPSDFHIGDSIWEVQPSDIIYSKNRLLFDHFEVAHNKQHLIISGLATPSRQDSLLVELKDIDVNYILNLVNFHAVEFGGRASGQAYIYSLFSEPDGYANLNVKDFTFEQGEMGTLDANVSYNKKEKKIEVNAKADDGPGRITDITGYISPANDDILLDITANGTPMYFLKSFTDAFIDKLEGQLYGKVSVVGPMSQINLVGNALGKGECHLSATNCTYTFDHVKAVAVRNEIRLMNDTIYDENHNIGVGNFILRHDNLSHLTFDGTIEATNLLCYDEKTLGNQNFCGTVYGTGTCAIKGRPGVTTLDINVTPDRNSVFTYNAASPDNISSQDFIHWRDITPTSPIVSENVHQRNSHQSQKINIPSDLHINFLVNTNPDLTLKVLMDNNTGDYIALNGNGVIRASYFNKGSFDMYGNFIVDHGFYDLTIQNVIKRNFQFEPGGTISFGGDAFVAPLNLKAKYTVNGVSLSDLNMGHSFSNNNIRVDCIMNITGTPKEAKIDFNMDLPTVNSDAKQMIYSLINSENEMNQQVLYLLAIGRFMAQSQNNSAPDGPDQQSRTSLAMQSILSGTISSQINNILASVVKNTNWNFGANISTGDEGFNNAEYEGILSGRLFNNRLIFNGQFGYRDNANATTSFIGDFDLKYLLFPNGNFALHMYNQTNDRYFIKNTMNTQGIGIVLKKDFNGWRDLIGINRKKKKYTK